MNRLTRHGKINKDWVLLSKRCSKADGDFCPHAKKCNLVDNRTCPWLEALDKLAAYEDTGLTPSDIVEMISEVERLKAELDKCRENKPEGESE